MTSGGDFEVARLGAEAPPDSLRAQVRTGTFWIVVLRVGTRGLAFGRRVILARLLGPEDMGTMGVALLFLSMLEAFTESGLDAALIHRGKEASRYFDTAQTMRVVRGLALGAVMWVFAPAVASFFAVPAAAPIIRAMSLVMVLKGCTNVATIDFRRELDFRKQFILVIGVAGVDLVASLAAAVVTRDPFAIIWGLVAGNAVGLGASFALHPYRPRPRFSWAQARELFAYSRWIYLSGAVVFLITHGDDVLVGRLLGATALGSYQVAYTLSNLPTTEVVRALNMLSFPLFAKLKADLPRLRPIFLTSFELSGVLSMGLSVILIGTAEDLVPTLLGSRWSHIVPIVQILAVWGVLRALGAATSPVLQALGRPRLVALLHATLLVSTLSLVIPLTRMYGLVGAAIAVTAPNVLLHWFRYPFLARALETTATEIWGRLLAPTLGAAAAITVVQLMQQVPFIATFAVPTRLLVRLVLIAAVFSTIVLVVDASKGRRLRDEIRRFVARGA